MYFLNDNGFLKSQFDEWGLNIKRLETWRTYLNKDIQFVARSMYVVENLNSIYDYFLKKQVVIDFAYDGCMVLGVTWVDFIKSIGDVAEGVISLPIYEALEFVLTRGNANSRCLTNLSSLSKMEHSGAAFAEFPYKFEHDGTLLISSVSKNSFVLRLKNSILKISVN